jgi:3-methylcrotonyl-CoA carboxylase alpha subunit
MFKKILIANRGEIAVRIMATCREMGIATVTVYSEADRRARHVREADEAYDIGPAPATQSYLRIETILDVAKKSGAEAIHPGYGFLAENADFAEACQQAGIVFIGPTAAAMRLMGSKIAAKRLAQEAGVPTVPGYHGDQQDDATLLYEAERCGFPLLIKASAGGGGKGMRSVFAPDNFLEQLAGARREAQAAFGDEAVFLERLVQQPRHIEIQILGDHYGHIVHLGERECSIQRRHQKIVEESPSIALDLTLRAEMGEAALRISSAAGYSNAGTVEFILDRERRFYFLEMNTRLQVEHPVTEFVTGLDLVRHQIAIAAGEHLNLTQEQISLRGHAIEVRLYAEDPAQQFLPSTGIVTNIVLPAGPGIRIDSGIESGDEITQYYDPLIAKVIASGEDREAARRRLQHTLERSAIFGVTSNLALLQAISASPLFQAGELSTDFLTAAGLDTLPDADAQTLPDLALVAAALYDLAPEATRTSADYHQAGKEQRELNPWRFFGPWRMADSGRSGTYQYQASSYHITLQPARDTVERWQIQIRAASRQETKTIEVVASTGNEGLLLLRRDATQERAYVQRQQNETIVILAGKPYHFQRRQPPDINNTAHTGENVQAQQTLKAPMAGTIVKVLVQDGEVVKAHQVLVVLSAMKMEHAITAPYAGKVHQIFYSEGSVVKGGSVIVEIKPYPQTDQ